LNIKLERQDNGRWRSLQRAREKRDSGSATVQRPGFRATGQSAWESTEARSGHHRAISRQQFERQDDGAWRQPAENRLRVEGSGQEFRSSNFQVRALFNITRVAAQHS
jgi:hypothetical protein